MAACFRLNLQSASSSNNGAGGINLGPVVGGRRPPSQQSFHSSKNNHSHHSRHQTTSAPPSTPRNACQQPEIAARCIRKLSHKLFHLSLSRVFNASDAVDDDSRAVLRLPLVGPSMVVGKPNASGFHKWIHVSSSFGSKFLFIRVYSDL